MEQDDCSSCSSFPPLESSNEYEIVTIGVDRGTSARTTVEISTQPNWDYRGILPAEENLNHLWSEHNRFNVHLGAFVSTDTRIALLIPGEAAGEV